HTVSLHRTGGGSGCPAPAAEDQPARPVASQSTRPRRSVIGMTTRTVVPTFAVPAMENQRSGGVRPSSCESRVSVAAERTRSLILGTVLLFGCAPLDFQEAFFGIPESLEHVGQGARRGEPVRQGRVVAQLGRRPHQHIPHHVAVSLWVQLVMF